MPTSHPNPQLTIPAEQSLLDQIGNALSSFSQNHLLALKHFSPAYETILEPNSRQLNNYKSHWIAVKLPNGDSYALGRIQQIEDVFSDKDPCIDQKFLLLKLPEQKPGEFSLGNLSMLDLEELFSSDNFQKSLAGNDCYKLQNSKAEILYDQLISNLQSRLKTNLHDSFRAILNKILSDNLTATEVKDLNYGNYEQYNSGAMNLHSESFSGRINGASIVFRRDIPSGNLREVMADSAELLITISDQGLEATEYFDSSKFPQLVAAFSNLKKFVQS